MAMLATGSTFFTLHEIVSVIWPAANAYTPSQEIVAEEFSQPSIPVATGQPQLDSSGSPQRQSAFCPR
jgi:hypothetical protein